MTKIRQLDPDTVSKIAAGEVVERPMNIVKELVENSLDANADRIRIIISDGGKSSIQVNDNGDGIPKDELETAFKLHTTSKLEKNDPSIVTTLGFRGEALASIASVTRIEAKSRYVEEEDGKSIVIEGGKIITSSTINMKPGTQIAIKGIFYNTPARRKFMKTAATERKRITDLITNYALMYPEIHFILEETTKQGKFTTRLESPSRKSILSVVYDVLGADIAGDLISFDHNIGSWDISGYISKPHLNRSDRSLQFINVNGRPIQHQELQKTIEKAYGSQMMKSSHPVLILKFTGPVDAVDFNIHPQKSEIRFQSNDTLLDELPDAILETLYEETDLPELQKGKIGRIKQPKEVQSIQKSQLPQTSRLKHNASSASRSSSASSHSNSTPDSSIRSGSKDPSNNTSTGQPSFQDRTNQQKRLRSNTRQTALYDDFVSEERGNLEVLGHIMNKFGLIFHEDELWLMDVHASDERIKFEMYSESSARRPSSQQFLQPFEVELPQSEKQLLLDHKDVLDNFGLKLSDTNGPKILVHSMPVYYDQKISPELIQKMLNDMTSYLMDDGLDESPVDSPFDRIEYAIVSRLACHGSIRSGYPVSKGKIREVLEELLECDYPWTCAHGRPTILRLPKTRLEGWFKR